MAGFNINGKATVQNNGNLPEERTWIMKNKSVPALRKRDTSAGT